uniref:BA14K family protein n=1 Tax=Oricola nitratireducens TaxID=2775868 RepID=UPI001866F2D3
GHAAAAAIIGLAGVAILAGALSQANRPPAPRTYQIEPDRYPPAPARSGPNVITYESTLEPWTPEWYDWCDRRYRSFNGQTGTFRGYDGRDHFCVPR